MLSKEDILTGWGNAISHSSRCIRPEKYSDFSTVTDDNTHTILAAGNHLTYGDQSISLDTTIDCTRMNRCLSFDTQKGILRCEAGITVDEIMRITTPKGWILPTIPGTKYVTLGGAFASNVHGKNAHLHGEFAEHVQSIMLRLADGSLKKCTPKLNKQLFWASAAGLGLTGIIESLTVQLLPISSQSLDITTTLTHSLAQTYESLMDDNDSDYCVAWLDHCNQDNLGQGYVEHARHIAQSDGGMDLSKPYTSPRTITLPTFTPSIALNRYSMSLYNRYVMAKKRKHPHSISHFHSFFFPLDSLHRWNRLYGKRGFLQFQCMIPHSDESLTHLEHLLHHPHSKGQHSFLVVLKKHKATQAPLGFSLDGISLAMDFPNHKDSRKLLSDMTDYIIDIGGKMYLAKDSTLTSQQFEALYGDNLESWRKTVQKYDPEHRFDSHFNQRLSLKTPIL